MKLNLYFAVIVNAHRVAKNFAQDTAGAISIIFGICAVMLVLVVGAAVDFTRWYNARSQTASAMDAAARALQTNGGDQAEAMAVGEKYFEQATIGVSWVKDHTIKIEFVDSGTGILGSTKASVATPFMGLAGIRSLPLFVQGDGGTGDASSTGGEYAKSILSVGANANTNVEISLMLDVTGSMCDDGNGPCTTGVKIDALKAAAKDLVNIVIWKDQGQYTARVALVPFSTRVRLADDGASDYMKKLTNLDDKWTGWYKTCTSSFGGGSSEGGGNWTCNAYDTVHEANWKIMPCVTDRTGPQAFTDAAPDASVWLNAHGGDRMATSWDSSDQIPNTATGKTNTDPATHWNYNPDGNCADIGRPNIIVPLTSDKSLLADKITALQAYGSTSGALGTAWAWYMLSPNWSNIWPSESRPAPYSGLSETNTNGQPKLKKIAVLMTDGSYNTYRGWKDQSQAAVSANAKDICDNMKSKGITVYSVAFNLDQLPPGERTEAENVLSGCGSSADNFYQATNGEQLRQAFRDIALKTSALIIAK